MDGARQSSTDESTSMHYCGCIVDFERDRTRRAANKPTRAETIHTQRRCVRYAFNQPKGGFGIASKNAADKKRISSASLVSQLKSCAAAGQDRVVCACTAEKSRAVFGEKGRKQTLAALKKHGYAAAKVAECTK